MESNRRLDRLTGIYRRFKRAPLRPGRFAWWADPPGETAADLGGLMAIIFAFALAPWSALTRAAILGAPPPAAPLLLTQPWLQSVLLAGCLINAFVVDGWLAATAPRGVVFKTWLRGARFAMAGVPFLGLYTIPGWRWMVARRSRWATLKQRAVAGPTRPRRTNLQMRGLAERARRRVATDAALPWLVVGNVVLVLWTFGLPGPDPLAPGQQLVVATAGAALHLVVFAAVAWFLWHQAGRHEFSRMQRIVVSAPAVCWLVPIPYLGFLGLVLVFVFFVLAGGEPPREQTLARAAGQDEDSSPEAVQRLRDDLRQRHQAEPLMTRMLGAVDAPPPREPSWAEGRRAWLYRAKAIVLAFDAIGLAWVVMKLARWRGLQSTAAVVLESAAYLAFGVCVVALAVVIVHLARKALGSASGRLEALDRYPYAQTLAASQFALCGGLLIGVELARDNFDELGAVLLLAGLLGCAVEFSGLLLSAWLPATAGVQRSTRNEIFGLLGFLLVLGAGETIRRGGPYQQTFVHLMVALTVTAPIWGPLFVRLFSGWLLRPFDIGDALSASTPRSLRRRLQVMVATLLLPLGGLFVPLWILWRRRYLSGSSPNSKDSRHG